ncbi:MAG: hypothetical protein ACRC6T_02285 [Sarcina sp.]
MDNYQNLIIKRSNQFLHTLARITIIIDNNAINENNIKLYPGETESCKIECGYHLIYCKLGTFYSQPIEIILEKDDSLSLEVGINLKGFWQTLCAPYYWIFKNKSYLYIK